MPKRGLKGIPHFGKVGSDLVGYEFDGVVDNGFAPTGQIAASTTIAAVPEILQNFGLRPPPAGRMSSRSCTAGIRSRLRTSTTCPSFRSVAAAARPSPSVDLGGVVGTASSFLLVVPAELLAHGGQDPIGKQVLVAGLEAGEQG